MKTRDNTIDILRGLAIFTMIAANMAAYNYEEPHPFLFRLYGSFAAPAFVLLSGFMVPFNARKQEYGFWYFFGRGFATVLIASLIDLFIWKLVPFTSFDVLYVIGITLPVSFLISKINKWIHLGLALLFFAAAPIMQSFFGYGASPAEVSLQAKNIFELWHKANVTHNFFVDGWFPIFPWMGVALFGSFIGRLRLDMQVQNSNKVYLTSGIILFVTGIAVWIIQNPKLIVREGYSELFYPPTIGYLFTFLGGILTLIALIQPYSHAIALKFFSVYGRSSLLMYILHSLFIVFIFKPAFEPKSGMVFMKLYLIHAFFLWWIALFIQLLKEQINRLPFIFRFILGG